MYLRNTTKLSLPAALLSGALVAGCAGTGGSMSHGGQGMQANPLSSDVKALEGMRATNLDSEMNRLGFTNAGGYQSEGAAISTWWRPRDEQCVNVATRDGHIASVEAIYAGNCR